MLCVEYASRKLEQCRYGEQEQPCEFDLLYVVVHGVLDDFSFFGFDSPVVDVQLFLLRPIFKMAGPFKLSGTR